jgi:uncharacterized protein YndB with AHSA1/START domain
MATTTAETKIIVPPNSHSLEVTREFGYPREMVFKAFTDPKAIPQWWGPEKYETTVEKMDAKAGGSWRFVQRDPDDGSVHSFRGVYHEVMAPERLIYTFEYEPMPGHVLLETILLEDLGGRTLVRDMAVFQTIEDRDGMVDAGMETGARESMERLEKLLASM